MAIESRIYESSIEKAYAASLEALRKNGFEIMERREDSIKATSSLSLLSWGEDIDIHLVAEPSNRVKITVSSSARSQLFDWGKSSNNISKVFRSLDKLLKKTKEMV
jgi:hypothetical protein